MNQTVIYTLVQHENLGCFPECIVTESNENGELQVKYIKLTPTNKQDYAELFDSTDEILINCCFQLDTKTILSKLADKKLTNWDSLMKKYFSTQTNKTQQSEYIRNYLTDYINNYQNRFYENAVDKQLYLPNGKFPFSWQRVHFNADIPELYYCYDYNNSELNYHLQLECGGRKMQITNGILVSKHKARVLLNNKIIEFDDYVDGTKLLPFLKNEMIRINRQNTPEYIEKVIVPMVSTNHVICNGIDIQYVSEISKIVLRVRETQQSFQRSLFDETQSADTNPEHIILELLFIYDDFIFKPNLPSAKTKLECKDKVYSIRNVQRDEELEGLYLNEIKQILPEIEERIIRKPYYEGIDWLNDNYKYIEAAGISVEFKKLKADSLNYFMGERILEINLNEGNDWFDISGRVVFGDYEIPFLQVLNYIRHNKKTLLLPNGEYAQIPQSWFDEYSTLASLAQIDTQKATVSRHYMVMIDQLARESKISVSMKDNMRRLLNGHLNTNYDLPLHFNGQLRTYQQQGYNWLRLLDELSLGGCLADDMGLGKTIQTLCLLQWMKEQGRAGSLLVVPTSLLGNWQQEAAHFTPDIRVHIHNGLNRARAVGEFDKPDLIITSYSILRRDKDLFMAMLFNYVILDESQVIKNPNSDINQVCLNLRATRYLTLTGTPIENSLNDLWSQVHFFNRNMLGTVEQFSKNCKDSEKKDLYSMLLKPFLLRRHKSAVLTDLPEKTIIVQKCEMSDEQHLQYKDIRNSYRDKFLSDSDKTKKVNPMILLEGLLRMRQIANHPFLCDKSYTGSSGKFDMVTRMLLEVISQGEKILLFSSFVEHLKIYTEYLNEQKIKYCYLDGSTKNRQDEVDRFQNDENYPVFLLSLKAGGTGLNLTRASYVFLLDPWWNPAAEAQAYDRAHRIGQKNSVFVYKFITSNTIEEKILRLQEKKLLLSDSMLENDLSIMKQLDIESVMQLID